MWPFGLHIVRAQSQSDTRRGHKARAIVPRLSHFPFGSTEIWFDVATEVASDVVSHHIWGPRKKSWSLPMTILAGIMRNAGRHSNLVDIVGLSPFYGPPGVLTILPFLRLPSG